MLRCIFTIPKLFFTKCPVWEYLCNLRYFFLHSSRSGNFLLFCYCPKIYFAYVLCLHDFFFKFHALTAFFLGGVVRCISISAYTGVYIGSFVYFEKQKRGFIPPVKSLLLAIQVFPWVHYAVVPKLVRFFALLGYSLKLC